MAGKVVSKNEIYLGGTYYPLTRPVQSVLASVYPSKVVIGDTTKDSSLRSSVVAWSDWRGGIGVERMQGPADADRAWYSTCNLRHRHHLVLPSKSTATSTTDATGASITGIVNFIQDKGTQLYAGWGTKPYVYSEADDRWTQLTTTDGGDPHDFASDPTDSITVRMGDTDYVVVAHTNGFSHWSTNVAVTENTTKATKYLAFWDDRLWGISSSGDLWYTLTIGGTQVDDAKLPVEDGYVTDLLVGRDATGEQILYAATKVGLFAHDVANSRFVETQFQLPFHNFNGVGSVRWRDAIYNPSGLGIYKYINGNNNAVVTVMGPDRDDGVPASYRGTIMKLAGTHTELMAAINATTSPGAQASTDVSWQRGASTGFGGHSASVVGQSTGQSSILAWNDMGWETKWVASEADKGKAIDKMLVSNAGKGDYRLWWGFDAKVYHQLIPYDVTNPSQLTALDGTDYAYAESAFHETPWFDAQQSDVDKLALKLKVECQDISANETVAVSYATDYSATYTALTTITTSSLSTNTGETDATEGTYTYLLPNEDTPNGVTFRSIRFKLTLSRQSGDAATIMKKTPDVVSTSLEYRKKLDAKYGHSVEVNLNKTYKGKSPKQLRAALVSAIESNTLNEFTFRDDSDQARNYYVDVTSATGVEYTGYDERGTSRITLVEP